MYEPCLGCQHYNGKRNENKRIICIAFPSGIPDDINSAENPHLEIHPNQDNDIVFELRKPTND